MVLDWRMDALTGVANNCSAALPEFQRGHTLPSVLYASGVAVTPYLKIGVSSRPVPLAGASPYLPMRRNPSARKKITTCRRKDTEGARDEESRDWKTRCSGMRRLLAVVKP